LWVAGIKQQGACIMVTYDVRVLLSVFKLLSVTHTKSVETLSK